MILQEVLQVRLSLSLTDPVGQVHTKLYVKVSFKLTKQECRLLRFCYLVARNYNFNMSTDYQIKDQGLAAIYEIKNGTGSMHYIHTDHLGSISVITGEKGAVEEEMSFDAWGRRRNPANWSYTNVPESVLTDRGYTLHEHLDEFGLINMNGRLYDPIIGRFLSPDNFVQGDFTQSFNRYSYCFNNPLVYTDPDGEWIHLVVGAVIGGITGTIAGLNNGATGWELVGYIAVGAGAGALSAGIGAGVNAAIAGNAAAGGGFIAGFTGTATISSTGFIAGAATGAAAGVTNGLITGTGYGMLGGQNFGNAFVQGGLDQAWKQGLAGGAIGGVFGGINAVNNERTFWTGNAKTYEGTPALYASLDGGSEVYLDADEYTVFNASGKDVYYKPEDGIYGIKNKIPDGHGIKLNVDGVATSKHTSHVFKIPGKYGFSPDAYVKPGGDVRLTFSTADKAALKAQQLMNPNYKYGWMTLKELGSGWETLFKLSLMIK